MDNRDKLSDFGSKYIGEIYNSSMSHASSWMRTKRSAPVFAEINDKLNGLFDDMTEDQKLGLQMVFGEVIQDTMFEILKIFDVDERYKLLYESNGQIQNIRDLAWDNDYGNGFLYGELFNWLEVYSKKIEEF